MSERLMDVKHVDKRFKRGLIEVQALIDINMQVHAGDFVSLMGPSGSGKSTLLNILAGIDHPTGGKAHILDKDLSGMKEGMLASWRNEHVGFVFQQFHLIPVLTAYENIELPLLLTRLTPEQRKRHVQAALALTGLTDHEGHYPRELSGGQEQRVSIARAIVTDPTFILADEPTGDLDATSAKEILDVLQQLNRDHGKTIIMVTHDPRADQYASIHYHIDKGRLSRRETPSTVDDQPPVQAVAQAK
jgi:putative ABC transport system ATP-binding protein